MARKKAYYDLSAAEKDRVRGKAGQRRRMERDTGYRVKGPLTSYEKGLQFGGTPQGFRRGFSKVFGKPKSPKSRSEFRLGVLDSYRDEPDKKPKKRKKNGGGFFGPW